MPSGPLLFDHRWYFVGQDREMLISNLDDYRGNFEDLKYTHLMSRRPN